MAAPMVPGPSFPAHHLESTSASRFITEQEKGK